jgi:hypothetical protein
MINLTLLLFALLSTVAPSAQSVAPCLAGLPVGNAIPSKAERIEWARQLVVPFDLLLRSLPALTPREQDWLATEMNAGIDRQLRAQSSTIGRQSALKEQTETLVRLLKVLSSEGGAYEGEVALWASVVSALIDPDLAANVEWLADEGVLPARFAGVAARGLSRREIMTFACAAHARRIQDAIVVPFFR